MRAYANLVSSRVFRWDFEPIDVYFYHDFLKNMNTMRKSDLPQHKTRIFSHIFPFNHITKNKEKQVT